MDRNYLGDGGRKMFTSEIKRDGHIHTPFCPHGSKDELEAYVQKAISLGLEEISFTEHFPLPKHICDPQLEAECALDEKDILPYFEALENVKTKYSGKIKINRGFEVDYIEGREEEIKNLLNQYGEKIEDSILSTHFVKYEDEYYAIDWEKDAERLLSKLGQIECVYDLYFKTLLNSIRSDLGPYKPKRIGHPSLVRIFQKRWPLEYEDKGVFEEIAQNMKDGGYAFDLNVAGLRRPKCGETYPSGKLLEVFKAYHLPYVYGSDSHEVSQMEWLNKVKS